MPKRPGTTLDVLEWVSKMYYPHLRARHFWLPYTASTPTRIPCRRCVSTVRPWNEHRLTAGREHLEVKTTSYWRRENIILTRLFMLISVLKDAYRPDRFMLMRSWFWLSTGVASAPNRTVVIFKPSKSLFGRFMWALRLFANQKHYITLERNQT